MLTSSSSGAITGVRPTTTYYSSPERENVSQAAGAPHYDSVTLSQNSVKGESRFRKELASRLSQEVRTATTTGDIQALRQKVSSGTYVPDPAAIAARMLFFTEEA